jgi:chromatin segregation and condensation protein Rec8/ScpA/Scc1 (kleisin family)
MPIVQCKNCGLVALRDHKTKEPREVLSKYRDGEEISHLSNKVDGVYKPYEERPICFAQAYQLDEEMAANAANIPGELKRKEVFDRNRDCNDFMQWRKGMSPKEHLEVSIAEKVQLLTEQHRREERERADALRAEDLAWRKQTENSIEDRFRRQEERTQTRHDTSESGAQRRHTSNYVLKFLLALLAIAATGTVGGVVMHYLGEQPASATDQK